MASAPPPPPPGPSQKLPPLPPGWTEHKAPTGHSYYYNALTKTSTYTRPVAPPPPPPSAPSAPGGLRSTYLTGAPTPTAGHRIPPPGAAPFAAPLAHTNPPGAFGPSVQHGQQPSWHAGPAPSLTGAPPFGPSQPLSHPLPNRPGPGNPNFHPRRPPPRPRQPPQKPDKPRRKRLIPGAEPWVLVTTKAGRKFVHNPETKISLWKAPAEVQEAIDKLPEAIPEEELRAAEERRLRRRRERREAEIRKEQEELQRQMEANQGTVEEEDDEEEEEEEEEEEAAKQEDGQAPKRIKLDSAAGGDDEVFDEDHGQGDGDQGPVEYTEEDIEWQLAAMADEYALDPEDMAADDSNLDLASSTAIFCEMLMDLQVSPYKTWEQVLPIIAEDNRYTVLPNTKTRKEAFMEWCRTRIAEIKAEEAKKEKPHPKALFFDFLKDKSTGKLYWAEFKRKWRKEPVMRSSEITDKDREKMYRDYVARMKTSAAIRESDLKSLLKSTPALTRNHTPATIPHSITSDVRYHVLPPESRDSIIHDHLSRLPEDASGAATAEKGRKDEKSALALREREMAVRRERMQRKGEEERAKWMLRQEEEEIERAKMVGKKGLAQHLKGATE